MCVRVCVCTYLIEIMSFHDIIQILPFDLPFHLLHVPKFSTKLAIHTEANGRSIIAWQFPKAPRPGGRLPQSDLSRHVTLAIICVNGRYIDMPSVLRVCVCLYVCVCVGVCACTLNFYRVTNENKEDEKASRCSR